MSQLLDPLRTGQTSIDGTYGRTVVMHDVFAAMPQSQPVSETYGEELGYVAGNSALGVDYVAERFAAPQGRYKIRGIYMAVKRSQLDLAEQPEVVIWKDNNGMPGEEIYRQRVDENVLKTNLMSYQQLADIVEVDAAFHVGISIVESQKPTEVAGYYIYKGAMQNTAHFHCDGVWRTYDELGIASEPVCCGLYFGIKAEVLTTDTAVSHRPTGITIERLGSKIVMRGDGLRSYSFCDVSGKRVKTSIGLRTDVAMTDMHDLPSGLYLLTIETKDEEKILKILNTK